MKKTQLSVVIIAFLLLLASFAQAKLTTNLGSSGQLESVVGETAVMPGSTNSYKAILSSGNPCAGASTTKFTWKVASTGSVGVMMSQDIVPRGTVGGAYYATMTYKYPSSPATITIFVTEECTNSNSQPVVNTESLTVKVASTCTNECSTVGQKRCRDSLTVQSCTKSATGCYVWGGAWDCAANTKCTVQSQSTYDWCVPTKQSECSPNTGKCESPTTWRACVLDGGVYLWSSLKSVPTGYVCEGDKLVKKVPDVTIPVQPTCDTMNCNDNNQATSDSCVAGVCFHRPLCSSNELLVQGVCVAQECSSPGNAPCDTAKFNGYPDCTWDSSQCQGTPDPCGMIAAAPPGEGYVYNTVSCAWEKATSCSGNSDCGVDEVCDTGICVKQVIPPDEGGWSKATIIGLSVTGALILVFGLLFVYLKFKKKR